MPKWMIESYINQGKLKEIFGEFDKHSLPMYAVYKSVDVLPYRIRAIIDFLSEYFKTEP